MKNLVVTSESKYGITAYVKGKINSNTQHRINVIKQIFGYLSVQIYDERMNFDNAIKSGHIGIFK